jgi:hypothetical protein
LLILEHSALLVGTWGDSILLAIECMMVYRYFHKFSRDRWTLKSLVLIVLAIDCISSIGNYAYVYLVSTIFLIIHFNS